MKRLNLRHSFALALLFALIVPILAACGGGTTHQPRRPPAPAAEAPTAAAAPTAAPAEAATAAPAPTAAEAATAAPAEAATAAPVTPAAGNVLRVAESTWPEALAPQKASFAHNRCVQLNYEGLTRYDKDLKTVRRSRELEYNKDGTEITFKLRDGLKYSDGSPLTANDFVHSGLPTLDPHNPGDYQTSINMIKGADAIINTEIPTDEAKLPDLQKALGVQAIDDKTIKFTFVKPTPYFHTLAGIWTFYPAKQELIDKGGETWHRKPRTRSATARSRSPISIRATT